MSKWVAANEMVMVRIQNPNPSKIFVPGKEVTFEPQGVVCSMGKVAVEKLGEKFIDQTVRFTSQMQRDVFGKPEDEFYFVLIPFTAIIAVLVDDVATSH